jgi:hypothetical protein
MYATSMAISKQKQLIVADAGLSVLDIFSEDGKFEKEVPGAGFYPYTDIHGNIIKSSSIHGEKFVLWKWNIHGDSPPQIFSVITPVNEDSILYEATPTGFDDQGRLIVITTEKTKSLEYHSYIYIYPEISKRASPIILEIEPNMSLQSDLPRTWTLIPNNRILTFSLDGDSCRIMEYHLVYR